MIVEINTITVWIFTDAMNNMNFCVGVQWHPEFLITDFDKSVIYNFTENVKKNS